MRRVRAILLVGALGAGCTAAPPPGTTPVPGGGSRAPYDAPPVAAPDSVTIGLDMRAARETLALLSRPAYSPAEAKALEALPAVAYIIRDSNRPPETFERDLAAAFDPEARISVFDFRSIRDERTKWEDLLAMIAARETDIVRMAADRARALLPPSPAVRVALPIYLSFGISGRADHIAVPGAEGAEWGVVIDLDRALADVETSGPEAQVKQLSRLMAAEAFRSAWAAYRAANPAWQRRDPTLEQLEPLLRAAAETGPVGLYGIDENFFPLSVWLKDPMKTSLDEFNRVADRLVSSEGDLDERVSLAAEIRRPEFVRSVAGPAGTFVSDGVIQATGVDAYRAALAAGPRAVFEAYARASDEKGRALIPLAKGIRDRLAAAPPAP